MKFPSIAICKIAVAMLAGANLTRGVALAESTYPAHPIKIVVGSEAGSAPDVLARVIAHEMGPLLGQSVIVENKAGAAGVIGASNVALSPPDGYTLLMGTVSNLVLAPSFYSVRYDPKKSFTMIGMVASVPLVLVVSPSLNVRTYAQLQAKTWQKEVAAKFSYASPGFGGPQHVAGVLLQQQLGADLLHVPYKSGSAAVTAVAAGQVDMTFAGIPVAASLAQVNKVVPILISARHRSSVLPDVAFASEAGLTEFDIDNWHALVGPAHILPAVRMVLEAALNKALMTAVVKAQFQKAGAEPASGSGKQLEEFVASETQRWQRVVIQHKLKVQ